MLKSLFRPWKLALFAALAAYLAQMIPFPFGIFMMMMLGALWAGALLHLSMVLLILDCLLGQERKALVAIPVLFYAWGLSSCLLSWRDVDSLSRHVASMDLRTPIAFDPAKQVIVSDADAGNFGGLDKTLLGDYKLDVLYNPTKNDPAGYFAQRVVRREACPGLNSRSGAHIFSSGFKSGGAYVKNACLLRMPERPDRAVISLTSRTWKERWGSEEVEYVQATMTSGAEHAIVTTARTKVQPPIMILVAGCGLNDATSSWQCFFGPMGFPVQVGGSGAHYESASADVLARLLGLAKRAQINKRRGSVEIDFAPDSGQAAALREAAALPSKRADEFFAALPEMIANPKSVNSADPYYFLTAYPERNAANAELILDGLERLTGKAGANDMRRLLAMAVAAMPGETVIAHKRRILEIVSDPRSYEGEPGMLARLGDFGVEAEPVLRRELTSTTRDIDNTIAAALGYCRGGNALASPQTSAALLDAVRARQNYQPDYLREAVFRALLRMGDRAGAQTIVFKEQRLRRERADLMRTISPQSPTGVCRHAHGWVTQFIPR